MDLESRLAQALEELSHASTSDGSKRANKEWLPNEPAKYILIGHRDKINAVSLHPLYPVIASASVDATVKVWDWDSGKLERTLKSHTKAVSDCLFYSTGKVLGECLCTTAEWSCGLRDLLSCGTSLTTTRISLPLEGTNIPFRAFPSYQEITRSFRAVGIIQSGCGMSKQGV